MHQASLFENCAPLASVMPAIKAAMRTVAGAPEGEGRKALPDKINAVASGSGVRLTAGNVRSISKDTLDKWLAVLTPCIMREIGTPKKRKVVLYSPAALGTGRRVHRKGGAIRLNGTAQPGGQGRQFRAKFVGIERFSHGRSPALRLPHPQTAPALPAGRWHAGETSAAQTLSGAGSRAGPRPARCFPGVLCDWH